MRRSRKCAVMTSSHHVSENEEEQEQSVDDSEDEYKPEKGTARKSKRKSTAYAGTPRGRGKRSKIVESEEDSEEDEDGTDEDEESDFGESEESDEEGGKEKKSGGAKKPRMSVGKNQPDKDGNMELLMFKNDLTGGFRTDEKLCMWRRDGESLLQKYMFVVDESRSNNIIFKASSVYSCWEERRKNDFFHINVQLMGDKKDGKVKVVDIREFEKYADEKRAPVDITPRGAEGGENYEEGSEEEFDENDEDDE